MFCLKEAEAGGRLNSEVRNGGIYYTHHIFYSYDARGICGIEYCGTEYYFQKNLQGDVVRIVDGDGSLVARYVYDAWGNHKVLNADGTENTSETFIGNINPFRYRGYYYDTETGFYYLQTRYYDPVIGRFINADDISYIDPSQLNGCNLYAYCGNNPVMRIDANGNAWWHWLLGAIAVIGMVALSVVSFGIAVPLGAMVVSGIALGAITNIGIGIISGKGVEEIISGALTGGLLGGSMAFAIGLGMLGGAALAGIGTASATLSAAGLSGTGAFVLSSVTVSASYGISYLIESSYTGKKITADNFFASMAKGAFVGASLYGIGGLMGFNGWGLKPELGLIDKGFYYAIQLLFKNTLKLMSPSDYEGF